MSLTIQNFFDDCRYCKMMSHDPDPKEFPLYYKAKKYEYVLNPGERLFIPRGWFHFVDSCELDPVHKMNIAVNFWHISSGTPRPKVKWHTITQEKVFKELFKKPVRTLRSTNGKYPSTTIKHYFKEMNVHFETIDFADFLQIENPQYYIAQHQLTDPEFTLDENIGKINSINVWLNRGDCNTLMHNDGSDNWFCQVIGRKRVILCAPEEQPNLYTFNPYPQYLIDQIRSRIFNNQTFLFAQNEISSEIANEVLTWADNVILPHEGLLNIFNRNYLLYQNHLQRNGCNVRAVYVPPYVKFKLVRVHCHAQSVSSDGLDYTILFCITGGDANFGRFSLNLDAGGVHSSPNTFEYPITLKPGVYILPIKENPTILEDGSSV